ncbi:hypothetical protein T492DRAFT_500962 [Pavlovales sp. CCMP2436]|nr:hypothetical protein T492DRAFT_500962 [Pavlovales sp. CCMP2436]
MRMRMLMLMLTPMLMLMLISVRRNRPSGKGVGGKEIKEENRGRKGTNTSKTNHNCNYNSQTNHNYSSRTHLLNNSSGEVRDPLLHSLRHPGALPQDHREVGLPGAAVGALHHAERRLPAAHVLRRCAHTRVRALLGGRAPRKRGSVRSGWLTHGGRGGHRERARLCCGERVVAGDRLA